MLEFDLNKSHLFEMASGTDHISQPCGIKKNNPEYLRAKTQVKGLYSG